MRKEGCTTATRHTRPEDTFLWQLKTRPPHRSKGKHLHSLKSWKLTTPGIWIILYFSQITFSQLLKSRDISWLTKVPTVKAMVFPVVKTNRVLPRKCTGHNKHPLPTTQEKTIHEHHQMVNTKFRLIIFFAAKDGEALLVHFSCSVMSDSL